jgi:hypothetical protein
VVTETIQLFGRGSLHDYSNLLATALDATARKVGERLQVLSADELASAPPESIVAQLIGSGSVECPRLLVAEKWQKPAEEVNQQYREFGETATRRVPRFVLVVPFEGERDVFTLRANTSSTNPPRVLKIERQELHLVIDNPPIDAAAVVANFDEQIAKIEQYLGWSRTQIEEHNERLRSELPALVEARCAQLAAARQLQEDTGYPTTRPPRGS